MIFEGLTFFVKFYEMIFENKFLFFQTEVIKKQAPPMSASLYLNLNANMNKRLIIWAAWLIRKWLVFSMSISSYNNNERQRSKS